MLWGGEEGRGAGGGRRRRRRRGEGAANRIEPTTVLVRLHDGRCDLRTSPHRGVSPVVTNRRSRVDIRVQSQVPPPHAVYTKRCRRDVVPARSRRRRKALRAGATTKSAGAVYSCRWRKTLHDASAECPSGPTPCAVQGRVTCLLADGAVSACELVGGVPFSRDLDQIGNTETGVSRPPAHPSSRIRSDRCEFHIARSTRAGCGTGVQRSGGESEATFVRDIGNVLDGRRLEALTA